MPSRAEIVTFDDSPPPAAEANARGEHEMQYNARKQRVIREICHRAFGAAGLLGNSGLPDN